MSHKSLLIPKLVTVFREGYSVSAFYRDVLAGIVVGIVALPLAIAFAIASGVQPAQGLYTAVVAGFLISALSGSRVQIGGPTGAFIIIVYNIVQRYGYDGLVVATLMAGVILIVMGIARFGRVIEYIPYPITVGFTSGIAVIIFTTQLRDLLGLSMAAMPADFVGKIEAVGGHLATVNPWAVLVSGMALVIMTQTGKVFKRVPGSIVAILATTALVALLNLPVETIFDRFGAIPNTLPRPHWPALHWSLMKELISPALTIALLAGLESLLSAVVADGMTGFNHRSSMELVAQGVANIGSAIFGGIPATGAIARTATNVKSGGRTPVAGIVHALTLLLILMLFGKWAAYIPIPTLAAILVVVAYHMSEWRMFVKLFRSPKSDIAVLLTTFFLTIFVDLTVAIQVGFVLAVFLFMQRMVDMIEIESHKQIFPLGEEDDERSRDGTLALPKGVEVFEINGPFFFGAADKFRSVFREIQEDSRVLILRMRHVPVMDATGLRALEDIVDKSRQDKVKIILSGVQRQPRGILARAGLLAKIGEENVSPHIEAALQRAQHMLGEDAKKTEQEFYAGG